MTTTARTLRIAALAAFALTATACATATTTGTGNEPADTASIDVPMIGPYTDTGPVPDDGLEHITVVTINTLDPGDDVTAASPPRDDTGDGKPVAVDADPRAVTEVVLVTEAGTKVLDEPPAGLVPVGPADDLEEAALAAADPGSFIAVDVDGEVGPTGTRYVRSLDAIYTIAAVTGDLTESIGEPGTSATGDTGDATDEPAIQVDDTGAPDQPTDDEIAAEISRIAGVVVVDAAGPGVLAVSSDDEHAAGALDAIRAVPGVVTADPEVRITIHDDPYEYAQWALHNAGLTLYGSTGIAGADIDARTAWNVTTGAGVVVAVVDDGFDLGNQDLAGQWWTNPGEVCGNGIDDDGNGFVDDCTGWDFVENDNVPDPIVDPQDANGIHHGTHVSGIIAAARNGVGTVGAVPDAKIIPLKTGYDGHNAGLSNAAIVAAVHYAVNAGADVINMSLGNQPGTPRWANSALESEIAYARAHGVTVVVSAGNSSANLDSTGPGWPAGFSSYYDNVLTVAASTNKDQRASFSNYGSMVEILAPGEYVVSSGVGNKIIGMNGTSQASPYTAAAAAAVIASGQASTPAAVIDRLLATADQIAPGKRVDMANAVGYLPPGIETALSISVRGASTLAGGAAGALTWDVAATRATSARYVQMSVAAKDSYGIGALEGLTVDFSDLDGSIVRGITDASGMFAPIPIRDTPALNGAGASLTGQMSLPLGQYAFVVELLDDNGDPVTEPYVTYLSVGASSATTTTAAPGWGSPTTIPGITTPTPSTTPPGVVSPTAPTTTTPSLVDPTTPTTPPAVVSPTAPTTTTPSVVVPNPPSTTIPSGGGANGTTTIPPGGPATTPPTTPGTTPGTTNPGTTPGTTIPGVVPTTPPTTPVTPTTPTVGVPPTTTRAPTPGIGGNYRLTSISPATGPISGFTYFELDGVFPTQVPIYVWFGDQLSAVVQANGSGDRIAALTPPVATAGTRDIIVKFSTDKPYELRLADAWTYAESTSGGGASTTVPSGPNPTTPSPTTTVPTTTIPSGPSPTTVPTTTVPSGPNPTTPSPTTTIVSGGTSRPFGSMTLNPQPSAGALARLTISSWPSAGCQSATCSATVLA